jgi:hypothetical protein
MSTFQTLYKYRALRGEARKYTSRILLDQQLYYATPAQLNDPFDCRFQISMEGAPLTEFGRANCGGIHEFVEQWFRDEAKNPVCLLSLSEVNDDILMWSHYADCHTGVCLGLRIPLDNELHRVKYGRDPATLYLADLLAPQGNQFRSTIIDVLTTKAEHWAYEREWRAIEFTGRGESPLPSEMLSEVIFGCRTSEADKATVRAWLNSHAGPITIFRAHMKEKEFGLEIRPI